VLSSVKEANEKLQRDIEPSVKGEKSKLKEVRLENKRLIEQFERENIKLSK
jgi:vacuolar-type H+-ATPase subunit H